MAKDEVNIKVSADVAEAIRLWKAMSEGPEAMSRELEAVGKKGRAAASGMEAEFSKIVGTWTSITGAMNLARGALDQVIKAQQAYNQLVENASVPVDTLKRKWANQTGASNQQMADDTKSILGIAVQRAVTPETAFATATQLASSGFSPEEASGASLDTILKLANATNFAGDGADVAGMAGAMINFLQATKQPATKEAIEEAAKAVHGLFQGTDLNAGQLSRYAPIGGAIYSQTGMGTEQLGILSQFLDASPDVGVAGTAMKAAFSGLATAGGKTNKRAALAKLGLKPEDVDFVGEDILQIQERIVRGFESVPKNEANIAAATLFGQEGLLAKTAFFDRAAMATTRERMAAISSGAQFERAHLMTEGGNEAAARREQAKSALSFAQQGYNSPTTMNTALINEMNDRGYGAFNQAITSAWYNTMTMLPGMDAESALRATFAGGEKPGGITEAILNRTQTNLPADIPQFNLNITLQDPYGNALHYQSDVELNSKVK